MFFFLYMYDDEVNFVKNKQFVNSWVINETTRKTKYEDYDCHSINLK